MLVEMDDNAAGDVLKSPPTQQQLDECGSSMRGSYENSWPSLTRSSQRPPMNVVVIKGTPESGVASDGSFFTTPSFSQHGGDDASSRLRPRSFTQANSSPFKLMPRTPVAALCSPSPTSMGNHASRGRKRRAHSISSPSSRTAAVPSDESDDEQRSVSEPLVRPSSETLEQRQVSTSDLLTMRSLSLQSPIGRKPTLVDNPRSPPVLPPQHNRTSSFTLYSAASPNSTNHIGSASIPGSVGSNVARTPCSSTKSSPRQVPLTVLSNSQGPSPTKSVTNRSLFFSGVPSLLHSLDGRVDDEDLVTPTRLIHSFESHSTPSEGRAISTRRSSLTPETGSGVFRNSRTGASPRTPLPRINLTPKTPRSTRSNRSAPFPFSASPANDGIDVSTTPQSRYSSSGGRAGGDSEIARRMDTLLGGFPSSSAQQRTLQREPPRNNADEPSPVNGFILQSPRDASSSSFLPLPTLDGSPGSRRFLSSTPQRDNRRVAADPSGSLPIQTKSVLTPSKSNGYLEEMMRVEARSGVIDAETGTLSDSDEEDFILTAPGDLTHERMELASTDDSTRARQRRRRSYDKPGSQSCSSASIASNKASHSSLFGMDLIQEENQSFCSSGQRAATPYSLSRTKTTSGSFSTISRKDGDLGSNGELSSSLARGKSEHSLGSLGLCIESGVNEENRDLVTPPATIPSGMSPPPLPQAGTGTEQYPTRMKKGSNMCVAAADHHSVSLAIAKMASEEHSQ